MHITVRSWSRTNTRVHSPNPRAAGDFFSQCNVQTVGRTSELLPFTWWMCSRDTPRPSTQWYSVSVIMSSAGLMTTHWRYRERKEGRRRVGGREGRWGRESFIALLHTRYRSGTFVIWDLLWTLFGWTAESIGRHLFFNDTSLLFLIFFVQAGCVSWWQGHTRCPTGQQAHQTLWPQRKQASSLIQE